MLDVGSVVFDRVKKKKKLSHLKVENGVNSKRKRKLCQLNKKKKVEPTQLSPSSLSSKLSLLSMSYHANSALSLFIRVDVFMLKVKII